MGTYMVQPTVSLGTAPEVGSPATAPLRSSYQRPAGSEGELSAAEHAVPGLAEPAHKPLRI